VWGDLFADVYMECCLKVIITITIVVITYGKVSLWLRKSTKN